MLNDEDMDLVDGETYPQISCRSLVSLLWDGIRLLPYNHAQVAACIATYLALAKFGKKALRQLFGNTIGVEFSAMASRNRALVSEKGVARSIRPDFLTLVNPDEKKRIETSQSPVREMLSILTEPSRLFVFSLFADLFVREIIPTQLWIRLERDMVIFSPARLHVFGID